MLRIGDDDFELIKKRYADGGRGVIFGQLKSQGSNFHIESFDHLLTAQGGMKGTSKPIYYRVLLNENAFWGPHDGTGEVTPLTKENLELCTYHMSLKYPTATKATREIPAVKYAKRVANQVLSGLKYLREGSTWFDKTFVLEYPEDTDYDDSERRPYMKMVRKISVHVYFKYFFCALIHSIHCFNHISRQITKMAQAAKTSISLNLLFAIILLLESFRALHGYVV